MDQARQSHKVMAEIATPHWQTGERVMAHCKKKIVAAKQYRDAGRDKGNFDLSNRTKQ